ncbi:MAG: NADH-quinone oxidoreductase subunit L, partial [Euryarchaeota archaeon]|nr:NADH-quinone oxidoreductase subunit L [Euryarchaeota archaeon]
MFMEFAWLIPALPFVAFLLILLLRGLPKHGAEIAIPAVFGSALLGVGVLWEAFEGFTYESSFVWMDIGGHE